MTLYYLIRQKKYFMLTAFLLGLVSVSTGEIINSIQKVTVYNDCFLLWIYNIPVFIILGGAMFSAWLFEAGEYINKKSLLIRLIIIFILSLLAPIIEIAGIKVQVWSWQRPSTISTSWLLGVWLFYFIFIVSPALIATLIKNFKSAKSKNS
jgi:DMSO reductase anchor subunit